MRKIIISLVIVLFFISTIHGNLEITYEKNKKENSMNRIADNSLSGDSYDDFRIDTTKSKFDRWYNTSDGEIDGDWNNGYIEVTGDLATESVFFDHDWTSGWNDTLWESDGETQDTYWSYTGVSGCYPSDSETDTYLTSLISFSGTFMSNVTIVFDNIGYSVLYASNYVMNELYIDYTDFSDFIGIYALEQSFDYGATTEWSISLYGGIGSLTEIVSDNISQTCEVTVSIWAMGTSTYDYYIYNTTTQSLLASGTFTPTGDIPTTTIYVDCLAYRDSVDGVIWLKEMNLILLNETYVQYNFYRGIESFSEFSTICIVDETSLNLEFNIGYQNASLIDIVGFYFNNSHIFGYYMGTTLELCNYTEDTINNLKMSIIENTVVFTVNSTQYGSMIMTNTPIVLYFAYNFNYLCLSQTIVNIDYVRADFIASEPVIQFDSGWIAEDSASLNTTFTTIKSPFTMGFTGNVTQDVACNFTYFVQDLKMLDVILAHELDYRGSKLRINLYMYPLESDTSIDWTDGFGFWYTTYLNSYGDGAKGLEQWKHNYIDGSYEDSDYDIPYRFVQDEIKGEASAHLYYKGHNQFSFSSRYMNYTIQEGDYMDLITTINTSFRDTNFLSTNWMSVTIEYTYYNYGDDDREIQGSVNTLQILTGDDIDDTQPLGVNGGEIYEPSFPPYYKPTGFFAGLLIGLGSLLGFIFKVIFGDFLGGIATSILSAIGSFFGTLLDDIFGFIVDIFDWIVDILEFLLTIPLLILNLFIDWFQLIGEWFLDTLSDIYTEFANWVFTTFPIIEDIFEFIVGVIVGGIDFIDEFIPLVDVALELADIIIGYITTLADYVTWWIDFGLNNPSQFWLYFLTVNVIIASIPFFIRVAFDVDRKKEPLEHLVDSLDDYVNYCKLWYYLLTIPVKMLVWIFSTMFNFIAGIIP